MATHFEIANGLLWVTIDRPEALNALNEKTLQELEAGLVEYRNDGYVQVVAITGAGRAFVAGGDIGELANHTSAEAVAIARRGQELLNRIERFEKPVIAAINGFALGGGCELALACHVRIATTNAQIGLPEVSLGIIPGYGGTQRLARLIGKGRALELMLTGNRVSAEEALRIGLVNKVVPPEELRASVEAMATTIMSRGPAAVSAVLAAVNDGLEMSFQQGLAHEAALFGLLYATSEANEGLQAFLEKRAPKFRPDSQSTDSSDGRKK